MTPYLPAMEEVIQKHPGKDNYAIIAPFGSMNPEQDIDMLFVSNSKIPMGKFFADQTNLMRKIKEEFKKNGWKFVPFSKLCY